MPEPPATPPDSSENDQRRDKKKDKVRSVWISFVGRIVAQIIGAVASVVLGIMVLQRYQTPADGPRPDTAPVAAARTPGQSSIAVLPFDNFSALAADAYFAAGMTEVLTSDLAQIKGWRVISRTSSEAYQNSGKSIATIGRELNVDLIVEGSVTKLGDAVRVVVQLIDAKSDEHLWSRSYDRTTRDLLALQSELAREIARSVKAAIVPAHEARLTRRASFNPVVYDLYLRGRQAWNERTADGLATAVRLFSEAIKLEPEFALAHVGLADAYSLGGAPSTGPAEAGDRMALARRSAQRALEIASHLAESHTAMAAVQFFGDRDLAAAERSFLRAIDLNPTYPIAHEWYAVMLAEQGRDAEATKHVATAVALNPAEATMHQAHGLVHYYARRYAEAVTAERQALAIRPQLPLARVLLIKAQTMAGDREGALGSCDAVNALASTATDLMVTCGIAWHRFGDPRAPQILSHLEARRPAVDGALAQWYAASGEIAPAMTLLRALRTQGNLPANLAFDPLFAALRADPGYTALMGDSRR